MGLAGQSSGREEQCFLEIVGKAGVANVALCWRLGNIEWSSGSSCALRSVLYGTYIWGLQLGFTPSNMMRLTEDLDISDPTKSCSQDFSLWSHLDPRIGVPIALLHMFRR
jgi:hypothetical protein